LVVNSTSPTYSAVWIGIGGQFENDSTLIQCGTEQDSSNGQAVYYAWYELLPGSVINITSINVWPGDQMQASIQLANAASQQWTINMTDTTRAESFQSTVTYPSSQLSAEWIVERPSTETRRGNPQVLPLADFGNATFTDCAATIGSSSGAITSFPYQQLIMYSSNSVQLTDVSDLTPDGSSFTVTYLASGASG